jgi:hypothetical protein
MRFLGDFLGDRFLDFFPPVTVGVAAGAAGGAGLSEAKTSMYPGPRALESEGRMEGSIILFIRSPHEIRNAQGVKTGHCSRDTSSSHQVGTGTHQDCATRNVWRGVFMDV